MGGKRVRHKLEAESKHVEKSYSEGASLQDLASEFSCSVTPIRAFLKAHKIKIRLHKPWKLGRHDTKIRKMYEQGIPITEIAEVFDVDRDTVSHYMDKVGIKRRSGISSRDFHLEGTSNIGIFVGLLEGEGSIVSIGSRTVVRIVNQDKKIIDWLQQWGGRVYWTKPRKRSPNPCGVWDLSRTTSVYYCLSLIMPYMVGAKKDLAKAAILKAEQNYGLCFATMRDSNGSRLLDGREWNEYPAG